MRAFALSKEGHPAKDVISSIIIERLLGTMALLVLVLGAIGLSVGVIGQDFLPAWAICFGLCWLSGWVGVLVIISTNRALLRQGVRLSSDLFDGRPLPGRLQWILGKLKEGYLSYVSYQDHKRELGLFMLLSFLESLFPIFWTYFLALAFGVPVSLLYLFILVPIVLVLVRLPISIDGFGIQEGAFVYFLGLIGVAQPDALLLGLASHILAILSVLPGGVLYGLKGLTLRRAAGPGGG